MPGILAQIRESPDTLGANGANIRELLPELDGDITLPEDATLRVSYKRQREIEKLTFKIFRPIRN